MKDDRLPRAAGIKDVARLAGVSTATVSRTLSNPKLVSEGTRAAVLTAVEATGYSANISARNLRQRRTGGVMAMAPNLANPFFSEILAGMSEVLRDHDLNLIVADTRIGERARRRLLDYADRSRVDGLLLLDGGLDPQMFAGPRCPPVIQVCEQIPGLTAPSVIADNVGGTCTAVAHLAERGYTRIGRITGPEANSLTRDRNAGFQEGMAAAGFEIRPDWTVEGAFSMAAGRRAAEHILPLSDRPDAIVCDSDEIACGLISVLLGTGLRIPEDMAVVGFDDIELASHITPSLTTIRQPRRQIGDTAARTLLGILGGQQISSQTIIPTSLIARASTDGPSRRL